MMDVNKLSIQIVKMIMESNLPITNIEKYNEDNEMFQITFDDKDQFLLHIRKYEWAELIEIEQGQEVDKVVDEYINSHTRKELLEMINRLTQENPLFIKLLFSSWKLWEMNLITDSDLDRIHEGLEASRERLYFESIFEMEQINRKKNKPN